MKTAIAKMFIEIVVECPNCDNWINLLDSQGTSGYNHNEEGGVIDQACPDGYWSTEHKKFEVKGVRCTHCKKTFNVKGLEW